MICPGGFGRFSSRSALALGLALPFALTAALQNRAAAQNAVPANLQQRDQELSSTREAQRKSADAEAALKREIEEIGADRRKLSQELIDTAAHSREFEAKIAATEARLAPLDDNEASIRKSLDGRRAVIGEVLAALQRIGHRPPPALISSPEDALQTVRTAMLLGAVLPEMRQQVDALASDLTELVGVRKKIAEERDRLRKEVASLDEQRTRMTALIGERQKQQAEREKALDAERTRAADLAKQVDNLKGLDRQTRTGSRPGRPRRPRGCPQRQPPGVVCVPRSRTARAGRNFCVIAWTSSDSG